MRETERSRFTLRFEDPRGILRWWPTARSWVEGGSGQAAGPCSEPDTSQQASSLPSCCCQSRGRRRSISRGRVTVPGMQMRSLEPEGEVRDPGLPSKSTAGIPHTHYLPFSSAGGHNFSLGGCWGLNPKVAEVADTQPCRVLEGSAEAGAGGERNVGEQPRHVCGPKTIAVVPPSGRARMGAAC